MWLIILGLSLLPIAIRLRRSAFPVVRAYLALCVALVVCMIPLHFWLNQRVEKWTQDPVVSQHLYSESGSNSGVTYQVTSDDIVGIAGPFVWRFFSWGIAEGGGAMTPFKQFLKNKLHIGESVAKRIDVTNPTPFMTLLWLLLLAWVTKAWVTKPAATWVRADQKRTQ